jgi:hypothetical protein
MFDPGYIQHLMVEIQKQVDEKAPSRARDVANDKLAEFYFWLEQAPGRKPTVL